MKIFLGADHRGFAVKEQLKDSLHQRGYTVIDCGNEAHDPDDDYPIFAHAVADNVAKQPNSRGIVLCGSGVGVTIVANKIDHVRCALGFEAQQVVNARQDDDINVLAIATDFTAHEHVEKLVEAFLKTRFGHSERAIRRIQQIDDIEQTN